jgi:two-component system sensor histidine kinase KdpD
VPEEAARPDPDALLASIKKESAVAQRGHLKVFFGMCPGVGKTYAMLQTAQQKQKQGVEVVVGIVETHGRKETEALLEGLAILPRTQIEYKGAKLEEIDLDALVLWHPPLVVVDELAHTNAPGSRHPKRYQDVLELLDAGIDVFTAVNVQHLESRADTVQQITGVSVRETIPDSVLDLADEIVLVDLTPEQLRTRLEEGKVYLGDRATRAADGFFKESNLTALREMALRYVAEHVDRDLRDIMRTQAIAGPWKTGDRLLVAVSASPFSEKLIRYTRRLAATMEASWIAANIDTGRALDDATQARLTHYLALARQLGAEVISTPGTDIGETLLRLARQHNVTQIVLGKPLESTWMSWLGMASPVDWLIRHSGEIDIHMIRSEAEPPPEARRAAPWSGLAWNEFGAATLIGTVVTGISLVLLGYTGYWAIALIYLLTVVLASVRLGRWATLYLAALSALLWDFLFIPPRFTLYIKQVHDLMMFGTYFVVALVIGHFTARLREREQAERKREERATALYRLTRALAASREPGEALATVIKLLRESFGANAAILLRDTAGLSPHPTGTFRLSAKEESVGAWAFQKRQAAGRSTDTLPDAEALHLPLLAGNRAEGVLAVRLPGPPTLEQRELLDAFTAQLAVFLEKERAVQSSRESQLAAQSEKLQKTLFDSVSHELKTPLAAMSAALQQPQPDRTELHHAVQRLTKTVDDLLDATRLESGLLQLSREWCDPAELLRDAVALAHMENSALQTTAPANLSPLFVDAGLIVQALVTLLHNAVNYSPPGSPLECSVVQLDATTVFSVADRGPGLAPGEETKVFEKFYRGAGKPAGGLGLGLAIARQLVEAHGGTITARNRAEGGARFSIRLPLGEAMKLPAEAIA